MGLLRLVNPLALHPTAPRIRTARAAEALVRAEARDADADRRAAADALAARLRDELHAVTEELRSIDPRSPDAKSRVSDVQRRLDEIKRARS